MLLELGTELEFIHRYLKRCLLAWVEKAGSTEVCCSERKFRQQHAMLQRSSHQPGKSISANELLELGSEYA